MSLTQLKLSRALWSRREHFRHDAKMKARAEGDKAGEAKWDKKWREARTNRKERDRDIAAATLPTRMSAKGLGFLKREEGVLPYAYNDPLMFATFGVGHLLHRSPVTAADQARWGTRAHPKPSLVDPTLRADLRKFENAVTAMVKPNLKQHQLDALVSFAFNVGIGGFESSTVRKQLNAGHFHAAADALLLWSNHGLLTPRRRRERTLFLTGKYT